MLNKVNVSAIVRGHLATLYDYRTKRRLKREYFIFFILPLLVGLGLVWEKVNLDKEIVGSLVAAMSIFAGFLFNLLALVYSLIDTIKKNIKKDSEDEQEEEMKRQLLKETHVNISYIILVSVLLVIILCTTYFLPKYHLTGDLKTSDLIFDKFHIIGFISLLLEVLIYSLLMNFVLTLLMILQRVHVLMKRRLVEE